MPSPRTTNSRPDRGIDALPRRRSAETKAAVKTTEPVAYVVIVGSQTGGNGQEYPAGSRVAP